MWMSSNYVSTFTTSSSLPLIHTHCPFFVLIKPSSSSLPLVLPPYRPFFVLIAPFLFPSSTGVKAKICHNFKSSKHYIRDTTYSLTSTPLTDIKIFTLDIESLLVALITGCRTCATLSYEPLDVSVKRKKYRPVRIPKIQIIPNPTGTRSIEAGTPVSSRQESRYKKI